MAVLTSAEKKRFRRLHQVFRKLALDARLSKLDSDGTYTGALGSDVSSTNANAFTINNDSSYPKLKFDVPDSGTGDFTLTLAAPATLGADRTVTYPDPGAGTFYWAVTTNSDGSVASGAMTGTTANSFEVDTGDAVPAIALAAQTAGTGDYTVSLKPAATLTGDRDVLFQDAAGTVCLTMGTPNASFTVLSGGSTAKIAIDTNSATGNYTSSWVTDNLTANRTITFPDMAGTVALTSAKQSLTCLGATSGGIVLSPTATGTNNFTIQNQACATAMAMTLPSYSAGTWYFAKTDQSDGTVTTGALTGTTSAAFEVATGTAVPSLAIGSQAAGTGDYTLTLKPATTLTADADVIIPDGADTFCMIGATQTLASKTLTSPHFNGGAMTLDAAVTVTGTWTDLGAVTTADINGGTIDGVTIGGAAAGAGSFTTLSSSGTAALNDATVGGGYGSTGVTISAAGVLQMNGALTVDGSAALNGGITVDTSNFTVSGTTGAVDSASTCGATAFTADDATTPTFQTASGKTNTGYFEVLGKTSGGTRFTTADATAQTVTITTAAQTGGAGVGLSIPDMAATSGTFVMEEIANTFTLGQIVHKDDTTDGVVDLLTLKHTSSDDNATALDGVGISIHLENATGTSTVEEWGSLDMLSTTITDGSEDGDWVFSQMLGGTVTETVRIDSSDQSVTIGRNATDANGLNKLRVYPLTGSKGSLLLSATASAGDTVTEITNASQAGARTYTVPDAGASASFVMTQGAQTIVGATTFSAAPIVVLDHANNNDVQDVLTLKRSCSGGNGANGIGAGISVHVEDDGGTIAEVGSLDYALSMANAGAEYGDWIVNGILNGAATELVRANTGGALLSVGASTGTSLNKVRVYPLTGSKGYVQLVAATNTNDVGVTLQQAGHSNARVYTFGEAASNKYVAYTDQSDGMVSRASIDQQDAVPYDLKLTDFKKTGDLTALPTAGDATNLGLVAGTHGTNSPQLQSTAANNSAVTEKARVQASMPAEYVAGETVTLRCRAKIGASMNVSATLDAEVYESDGETGISADLCTTSAQTITTSYTNLDFTITPTNLQAGDVLDIEITVALDDTGGGAANEKAYIGKPQLLLDIKG